MQLNNSSIRLWRVLWWFNSGRMTMLTIEQINAAANEAKVSRGPRKGKLKATCPGACWALAWGRCCSRHLIRKPWRVWWAFLPGCFWLSENCFHPGRTPLRLASCGAH